MAPVNDCRTAPGITPLPVETTLALDIGAAFCVIPAGEDMGVAIGGGTAPETMGAERVPLPIVVGLWGMAPIQPGCIDVGAWTGRPGCNVAECPEN